MAAAHHHPAAVYLPCVDEVAMATRKPITEPHARPVGVHDVREFVHGRLRGGGATLQAQDHRV